MEGTVWPELSRSSKQALRWAAAMACIRADRAGTPVDKAHVDEFDLLVGIMLAHPGSSEPRRLLAHVGASVAEILPPDYPAPAKDVAERYGASIPEDELPLVTTAVDQALGMAAAEPRGGEQVIELKSLFGGLLAISTPASTAFRDVLAKAGLPSVVDDYRTYLSEPSGDFGAFLGRHPYRAAPVEIPEYKADRIDKLAAGDDLLDIRAEVDAFAYLLASTSLKPPLAVGLFGDWGSGKTFFMQSVQERIAQLMRSDEARATPQRALPFWKQIVQIDFNAWHYVKGDLWASLVEHVFSELRVPLDEDDSAVVTRQKHWLEQIEAKRRERSNVLEDLRRRESDQKIAEGRHEVAVATREREERKLREAEEKARVDLMLDSSKGAAEKALKGFADQVTEGKASETLGAIGALAELYRRAPLAAGAYSWSRRRTLVAFGALIAVPVLVFALAKIASIPSIAQFFAGATAILAVVAGALRAAASSARAQLEELTAAETAVKADIEEQRRALDEDVDEAARSVDQARATVEELSTQKSSLEGEIAALEEQAKSVTSAQILREFLVERVGSSDYRQLLGTAALVQRDFEALSRLIDEQNDDFLERDTGGTPPDRNTVNRIILYIDDLDRCEPNVVIEVLQAVHLLLAFPLFVVVVAVDSRWLAHSLAEHYPALTVASRNGATPIGNGGGVDQASPSDYLEKIFQVPFWVEPLGDNARKSLVRGLLQGNLAMTGRSDQNDGGGGGSNPLEFSDDSEAMVDAMFGRTRAIRMETAALSVRPDELTFLDELAPLLGDTPRAIKRFVNVYQLLCALPLPPGIDGPLYEEAVAFLLAITDGLPGLSAALADQLEKGGTATLSDAVGLARAHVSDEAELARYDAWASTHPRLTGAAVETLGAPARRVNRFSFRS